MPLRLELELRYLSGGLKRESQLGNNAPQSPSAIAISMATVAT